MTGCYLSKCFLICANGSSLTIFFCFWLLLLSPVRLHLCLLSRDRVVRLLLLHGTPRWTSTGWHTFGPPEMDTQLTSSSACSKQAFSGHFAEGLLLDLCENFLQTCTEEQNCWVRDDADCHFDSLLLDCFPKHLLWSTSPLTHHQSSCNHTSRQWLASSSCLTYTNPIDAKRHLLIVLIGIFLTAHESDHLFKPFSSPLAFFFCKLLVSHSLSLWGGVSSLRVGILPISPCWSKKLQISFPDLSFVSQLGSQFFKLMINWSMVTVTSPLWLTLEHTFAYLFVQWAPPSHVSFEDSRRRCMY